MSARIRLKIAIALLIAGERVDGTFERKTLSVQSHQRLEASQTVNALLELTLSALLYLDAPFRIGEPGSAHTDEINDSALDESFRNCRLADGRYRNDRKIDIVTDSLYEIFSPALREGDRLNCHEACLVESTADVDKVDACGFHRLHNADAVLNMDIIFRNADRIKEFINGYAAAKYIVLTALLANILNDLEHQSHPVLEASAVLIRSLVGVRGEELLQQISMCAVELHAIDACLLAAKSGITELLYQLVDLIQRHRTGLLLGDVAHTVRSGNAGLSSDQRGDTFTAGVMQLNKDLASILVYCRGKTCQ